MHNKLRLSELLIIFLITRKNNKKLDKENEIDRYWNGKENKGQLQINSFKFEELLIKRPFFLNCQLRDNLGKMYNF